MCGGGSILNSFGKILRKLPGSDTPLHNALGLTGDQPEPPKPPEAPEQAPPQAPAPVAQNQQAQQSANDERRRRQRASGQRSTILTGPMGAGNSNIAGKTLLGA